NVVPNSEDVRPCVPATVASTCTSARDGSRTLRRDALPSASSSADRSGPHTSCGPPHRNDTAVVCEICPAVSDACCGSATGAAVRAAMTGRGRGGEAFPGGRRAGTRAGDGDPAAGFCAAAPFGCEPEPGGCEAEPGGCEAAPSGCDGAGAGGAAPPACAAAALE